ncbi:hypothetical protein MTR62_19410 [Novosphingobium sp. 1949]|uniref:Uncharacterized protein n=1 Tax=Novosphingobium organovorum TaxID=2930092 RepID=A0ABT0BIE4_9SPHN|nr:hypothetical protein [Novosphingobium organovorum]MCJ2184840.1 hypothetical protein [Novosphingobium organovorum]
MTDMTELARRKKPLNLAIVHVDPEAFLAAYQPWLEITAFLSALRAGQVEMPEDGITPALTPQQLAGGVTHQIGNDTLAAFCMTAAMKGDGAAVDTVEATLRARFGPDFPGHVGLWPFRGEIAAPVSLDDHVGQAGKKMLAGDPTPPPMRNGETWTVGMRFLERALGSNFKSEIIYPQALWTRARWEDVCEGGVAFMAHIEENLPILREALSEPRNDAAFIANLLLLGAPAVEMDLQDDVKGMLRSLARR